MRRIVQAVWTVFVATALAIALLPSQAIAQTTLPPDFDTDDVKVRIVNALSDFTYYGLSKPPTVDDIDMTRIVKIYVDTDMFALGTDDFDEVVEILEARPLVFRIDFAIEGVVFDVEVSKGLPQSEEAIERLRELGGESGDMMVEQVLADVGKWKINSTGHTTEPLSSIYYLDKATKASGITDREPIFVGGLPYLHYPVALYPDEYGKISVMVPMSLGAVPWSALKMSRPSELIALDYQEVKEVINSLPPESSLEDDWLSEPGGVSADNPQASDNDSSSTSTETPVDSQNTATLNIAIPVVLAVAVVITAIVLVARRRHRRRAPIEERHKNEQ
jgi:hypothetical protein